MDTVDTLVVGAGITGLAVAGRLSTEDYLVLEADASVGGYCRTVKRAGFVWDYSGHFFHFRRPFVEEWLRSRMHADEMATFRKRALIAYGDCLIDYPFQKNIHQLPRDEFLECLHDLYFARSRTDGSRQNSFQAMLRGRFGRGICERFLIPYNHKVYACDLDNLDADAMGRFFPAPSLDEVIRGFRHPHDESYNATFQYPRGGAFEFVRALGSAVVPSAISTSEPLVALDTQRAVASTPRREIRYRRLVSTMPLPKLAALAGVQYNSGAFGWSKVLVFNLGFDRKGLAGVHWIYYPEPGIAFYRVGFYDNLFGSDRLSIYVEVGLPRNAEVDVEVLRLRVLSDLEKKGVLSGHRLVAEHHVMLDPAYVHVSRQATAESDRIRGVLRQREVYSIGRYGGWRYCSIEDNIVEAWELAAGWAESMEKD